MTDLEEKKKGKGEERRGKKKTKYKGQLRIFLASLLIPYNGRVPIRKYTRTKINKQKSPTTHNTISIGSNCTPQSSLLSSSAGIRWGLGHSGSLLVARTAKNRVVTFFSCSSPNNANAEQSREGPHAYARDTSCSKPSGRRGVTATDVCLSIFLIVPDGRTSTQTRFCGKLVQIVVKFIRLVLYAQRNGILTCLTVL